MADRKPRSARGGKASPPRVSRLWPEVDPGDWRDLEQVAREELDRRRYEDNPPPGWFRGAADWARGH